MRLPSLRRLPPRKPRVLLVPNQWDGSVQEYYHFLLGYLGPVLVWLERHPGTQIAMRDCGPMQPWIDALLGKEDLEILNPGAMLHLFAGRRHKAQVLLGFDDPARFKPAHLEAFRSIALRRAGIATSAAAAGGGAGVAGITVIDRATSGEFNATAAAEVPASGAAVRSIPNLREVVTSPSFVSPPDVVQVVDSAHLGPVEQMQLFSSTSLLIGQHGAGLANMLWMPRGSAVVEILPPSPPWVEPIFSNLASALGHRIAVVRQDGPHSPVDSAALADAVASVQRGAV